MIVSLLQLLSFFVCPPVSSKGGIVPNPFALVGSKGIGLIREHEKMLRLQVSLVAVSCYELTTQA